MLTFEKVLEIFADYLTADETIEVYISRHGCTGRFGGKGDEAGEKS